MSRGQLDKAGYKSLENRRSRSVCCSCWTRKPWYFKMAVGISGVLVVAVVGLLIGLAASGPLHASCKIDWFVWNSTSTCYVIYWYAPHLSCVCLASWMYYPNPNPNPNYNHVCLLFVNSYIHYILKDYRYMYIG